MAYKHRKETHHCSKAIRKNIFSSVKLNKGSTWSDTVINDELYFPRLSTESQGTCKEIENVWMVGFIHHAKTTKDFLVSYTK